MAEHCSLGQSDLADALATIRQRDDQPPEVALITGSGLSGLAEQVTDSVVIACGDIPGWPVPSVAGHAGRLIIGRLAGRLVAMALGRVHLYEGRSVAEVTFGVRVLHALGARTLIVTNAAGGLNPGYRPGDVMILRDHLFLPGLAGLNPLVGPNDDSVGSRFPILRGAYDAGLADAARPALADAGLSVHDGVYAMVVGPSFETPAEARFLRAAGADAVGMSTVPEVVVARHAGMRVLGLSVITNMVPMDQPAPAEAVPPDMHEEVLVTGAQAVARLTRALPAIVAAG